MRRAAAVVAVGMCVPFMLLAFIVLGHAGDAGAVACGGPPVPGQPVTTSGPTYSGGNFTYDQLVALWISVGGPTGDGNGDGIPDEVEAGAIALAESGGDPNAGATHPYHGLWQVGPGGPWDPIENARAAVAKYNGAKAAGQDPFSPWTTYSGADTGPGGGPGPRTFLDHLPAQYKGVTATAGPAVPQPTTSACDSGSVAGADPNMLTNMLIDPTGATGGQQYGIVVTPGQRADLAAGGFDPRLLTVLVWIGQRHRVVITALRADHPTGTTTGNRSNHADGRAADIGMVDGFLCNGYGPADPCGQLLVTLSQLQDGPTELIGNFDPDGNGPAFACHSNACGGDHSTHLHVAFNQNQG